jgi:hypothetical protein
MRERRAPCAPLCEHAGGLAVQAAARAVLSESTITDCAAGGNGGGVIATDYANVTLQGGSRVERCLALLRGGALRVDTGSHAEIEGSILHECNSTYQGGGISVGAYAHVRMLQSSILRCGQSWEVGIMVSQDSTLLATSSVRALRIKLHVPPLASHFHQWRVFSLHHVEHRPSKTAPFAQYGQFLAVWPDLSTAASCGVLVVFLYQKAAPSR